MREDLVKKYDELDQECLKCFKEKNYKKVKELQSKMSRVVYQIEDIDKVVYDNDIWVSNIMSDIFKAPSTYDARQNLIDKVKNLNGVKVVFNEKHRVERIEVITHTKTYTYEIHCYNFANVIGKEMKDGIFGQYESDITEPSFQAYFKQTFNAYRYLDAKHYVHTGEIKMIGE